MAKDKFKSGSVMVEAKKDIPYFKEIGINDEGKPFVTPIPKDKQPKSSPQFKSGDRFRLSYKRAGILAGTGYVALLNEKLIPVDTKVESAKK